MGTVTISVTATADADRNPPSASLTGWPVVFLMGNRSHASVYAPLGMGGGWSLFAGSEPRSKPRTYMRMPPASWVCVSGVSGCGAKTWFKSTHHHYQCIVFGGMVSVMLAPAHVHTPWPCPAWGEKTWSHSRTPLPGNPGRAPASPHLPTHPRRAQNAPQQQLQTRLQRVRAVVLCPGHTGSNAHAPHVTQMPRPTANSPTHLQRVRAVVLRRLVVAVHVRQVLAVVRQHEVLHLAAGLVVDNGDGVGDNLHRSGERDEGV